MKRLIFNLLPAFLLSPCCFAQAQTNQPDTAVFNRIRRAEFNSSQIPQIAHYLTDVAGSRLTNSEGYRRAAEWAVATMKKWGLANAKTEPWGQFGKQWDLESFTISMTAPYVTSLRAYPNPWSPNTKGLQKGQVVVISSQQYLDSTYLEHHMQDFKSKFVLLTGKAPKPDGAFGPTATRLSDTALANLKDKYMEKRENVESEIAFTRKLVGLDMILKKAGALGLIFSGSKSANGTVFVQGYYGYKLTDPETLPQITIALEDAQKIKRLYQSGHSVEITCQVKGQSSTRNTAGYNVIGEIPGIDAKLKSQLVMLGGHLDSWSAATGATDNAAGCIVMLEAMRLLDSLGLKPKRTIRLALWDGEEQGLFGSYNYVKNHFIDSKTYKLKPEQAKVSAYFNLDNGTGKIRGIHTQNNTDVQPIFTSWFAPFSDLGAATVTPTNTGSTDHLSFDWAGIPGFQFVQDEIDYETRTHHSNMDDYDHLQMDDLKQAAVIVASFVYQASVRPELLPRKPLQKEPFVFEGL